MEPKDIEFIIFATLSPDHHFPGTGCTLQKKLGIPEVGCLDVRNQCSGFIYALTIADQFVRTGLARRPLVIGAETMSRIIDWTDRETCVLFGDGAGAVILDAAEEPGIIYSSLGADGRYRKLLEADSGISKAPGRGEKTALRMKGNEVFKVAVRTLESMVDDVIEKNDLTQGEIDWFVPHQANLRIISATAKRLKIPMERVVLTVAEHGNTSAASVPMALDTAIRDGRIQRGDLLLLEAFGGGFTWGASLIRY